MLKKVKAFFFTRRVQSFIVKAFIYLRGRAIRGDRPNFIKVGANDGLTGDPCGASLLNAKRWCGALVEPIPYVFSRLEQVYSDSDRFNCYQVAISNRNGKARIYTVDASAGSEISDLPPWWDQIASFVPGHIEKHLGGQLSPFIREIEVDTMTLSSFMEFHNIVRPTLLHVDTEGHDLEVLKSYNFQNGSPQVILIEYVHLSKQDVGELNNIIAKNGFKVVFRGDSDILAFQGAMVAWGCAMIAVCAVVYYYIRNKAHNMIA